MNKILITAGLIIALGCMSRKSRTTGDTGAGDTRTRQVEYINDDSYYLTDFSDDSSYGYEKSNPVKVGGVKDSNGPKNERRFLNALLGPNGEELKYFRAGSCCPFKTPNGFIGNSGMLDAYMVYWDGAKDTLAIYINMYDKGDLKVPVGLSARGKN